MPSCACPGGGCRPRGAPASAPTSPASDRPNFPPHAPRCPRRTTRAFPLSSVRPALRLLLIQQRAPDRPRARSDRARLHAGLRQHQPDRVPVAWRCRCALEAAHGPGRRLPWPRMPRMPQVGPPPFAHCACPDPSDRVPPRLRLRLPALQADGAGRWRELQLLGRWRREAGAPGCSLDSPPPRARPSPVGPAARPSEPSEAAPAGPQPPRPRS